MDKRTKFKQGQYDCPQPPSDYEAYKWSINQWIEWIDENGDWEE